MNYLKHVLLALLYVFMVPASAQDARTRVGSQDGAVLSPQAIVVNPVPSYEVEVFLDRDTSGDATPSYAVGESVRVGVRVSEAAYVYLFNVRSDNTVDQILPNNYDASGQNNFVQAGEAKYFPPEGASYAFSIAPPEGLEKVIAVASRTPLDTSTLANFERDPDFASSTLGEEGFADALSIIVQPLPQGDWVSDTALFYVGSASPPVPQYGTLSITSEPAGARVTVDNVFVGYTPLRYGTTSGNHLVLVEREGYDLYEATFSVTGGQTRDVQVSLTPLQRLGAVGFESNPTGAQVYVDGQAVGTTPTGTVELAEGQHSARFVLSGYTDSYVEFTVSGSGYQVVSGELLPQAGTLSLTVNIAGATVLIDGENVGTVPSGSGQLSFGSLTSGTHEVTVTAPGYRTYVGEFSIAPGQTTPLSVSLSRR